MKRIAVFAHYDKNSKIRDYVVTYLKGLKEVSDKIIFVSDCYIDEAELLKIKNYINFSICLKHGEYDFGSYKRGFLCAKENNLLTDCDELIFCNDSCYAPIFPFSEMFKQMEEKDIDFWGPIQNSGLSNTKKHIQSFFLIFRPQVFNSDVFKNFINSIKRIPDKRQIIETYECGTTKLLENVGFKWDVYSDLSKTYNNAYLFLYKELIKKEKYCFLKRTIPNFKARIFVYRLKSFIEQNTQYDYNLIQNDINHCNPKISISLFLVMFYKYIFKFRFCNKYKKEDSK